MSWIEQFAIAIVLGILNQVVKNPAKKEAVKEALLGIADQIDEAYGRVPPSTVSPVPNVPVVS